MNDESTTVLEGFLERAITGDGATRQQLLELTRDRLMSHARRYARLSQARPAARSCRRRLRSARTLRTSLRILLSEIGKRLAWEAESGNLEEINAEQEGAPNPLADPDHPKQEPAVPADPLVLAYVRLKIL
jgi:hypothetical protein